MFSALNHKNTKIAVIGLGYVGLPLAVEFGKKFPVVGYDIDTLRIEELTNRYDKTGEIKGNEINYLSNVYFTCDKKELVECNVYIVTVPTPITDENVPDLSLIIGASRTLGEVIKKGDIIVYESTVYPGATEEICVPELEQASGLKFKSDFSIGYSPERINPGDSSRRLTDITKIVSGSCEKTLEFLASMYGQIISAGIHKTKSIKIAEAAKVIENTQRDVNIALINDLSKLFVRLGIETNEVLQAAETKWNFLPFKPGLVGGHCIGVDPYYLTYKAQTIGHNTDFILSGRRINESVAEDIATRTIKALVKKNGISSDTKILILGCTFKENCPDIRNSKVFDLNRQFSNMGITTEIWDPVMNDKSLCLPLHTSLIEYPKNGSYEAIVIAVAHKEFLELGARKIKRFGRPNAIIFDVKSLFKNEESDLRL